MSNKGSGLTLAPVSGTEGDFETFYHAVCSDLQSKGEVVNMSKVFGNLINDEERMKFFLETKRFDDAIWPKWNDFNCQTKTRIESQRQRNLGNQVYQKNKLNEALALYSESICLAPHPSPPNAFIMAGFDAMNNESDSYEELSLGYANRSAVLFQLKEYELCLRDITRAFDHSYPNNLMYKLFERRARCLKALKDYTRALESMKNAEMWMRHSTLTETKSASFKKEIHKQIECLEEKVKQLKINEFEDSLKHRKRLVAPLKEVECPSIEEEDQHKRMPGVVNHLKMDFDQDRGRFLSATRDIKPGELLIVETPYSTILLPEHYKTHCQTCFQRITAPIPCWCCARVRFCSDECRSEAWERFHKVECQQLELLLNSGVGKNALLAFRILTSSGMIYLDYIVAKVREEMDARKGSNESQLLRGCNEEDVYDPADYRTIYTLVSNSKQRGVGDLFKRSLMAIYLLRILEMTPFFFNGGADPRNLKLKNKVAMASVLMKHLQNLPCNAHELSELEPSISCCKEIGSGVFGILSLINHSCDPNVVRATHNTQNVLRAIRLIRAGEELLDNYGYHYAMMEKEERQRKLHNQYYFHCHCNSCAQNWPLYKDIKSSFQLVGGVDNKKAMSEYKSSKEKYEKAFSDVTQGLNYRQALPSLLQHLQLLDAFVNRPFKEYNDCQEAIKLCWSTLGNVNTSNANKDMIV